MTPNGFSLLAAYLNPGIQAALVADILEAAQAAPFYRPITPSGAPMSVEMTNLGPLGWVTDASGYRYEARHPQTGQPWPPMPANVVNLWREVTGGAPDPDACLVNLYRAGARMGLHQDRDEADFSYPVVSISLGDTAVFRIGGRERRGPTTSLRLSSGDICILAGEARLAFHGVDRVIEGSSRLITGGGRLNLTLRRARL